MLWESRDRSVAVTALQMQVSVPDFEVRVPPAIEDAPRWLHLGKSDLPTAIRLPDYVTVKETSA